MNITTSKAHKSKLHRWLVRLQDYDFVAYYITGIYNICADYLSRDGAQRPHKIISDTTINMKTTEKPVKVSLSDKKHHLLNLDRIINESVEIWKKKQLDRQKQKINIDNTEHSKNMVNIENRKNRKNRKNKRN